MSEKKEIDKAEEKVSNFYNSVGWETDEEVTEDAKRFEDLRKNSENYVSKCRLRVLEHIPSSGENILDMASGPIQYKEYLEFSKNFKKRYCVDLSSEALESAKRKIGDHGEFLHGSFFDLDIKENFFDCSISLHTIYHINKDKQEEAVRKLIHVTKPGKPVIIVYTNPDSFESGLLFRLFSLPLTLIALPFRIFGKLKRMLSKPISTNDNEEPTSLYFYPHAISWWDRFSDVAIVQKLPWRSFGSDIQRRLIPDNKLGQAMFRKLFKLENRYPNFFVKNFQYPMFILTKK